jgi:hypothetical protein
MRNEPPALEALRKSFQRVYDGPDELHREYDLLRESEWFGMDLETYRRLYELRNEEDNDPYPKPEKWQDAPGKWREWFFGLHWKKRRALLWKGTVWLVRNAALVTVVYGVIRYGCEAPKREKLAHYQAWTMINSATGQQTSGGRIEALQDLNKDGVSLQGLNANNANLAGINLRNASIEDANLQGANLQEANLQNAYLHRADLQGAKFNKANFQGAHLSDVKLQKTSIDEADFRGANFMNANLQKTSFYKADLREANFMNANLQEAGLYEAKLQGANFSRADLQNATLIKANLQGTKFWVTQLEGAWLEEVNFQDASLCWPIIRVYSNGTTEQKEGCADFRGAIGLTPQQIKAAKGWEKAHYDPELRKELGLSPEPPTKGAKQ